MDSNKVQANIYIDISKAFDTLNHSILLSKLEYYGITGRPYDLLKNYLSSTTLYCNINQNITAETMVQTSLYPSYKYHIKNEVIYNYNVFCNIDKCHVCRK